MDPSVPNQDLVDDLLLTHEDREWNEKPIEVDQVVVCDSNFALVTFNSGFRIFSFEKSLNGIPMRWLKITGEDLNLITVLYSYNQFVKGGKFWEIKKNIMVSSGPVFSQSKKVQFQPERWLKIMRVHEKSESRLWHRKKSHFPRFQPKIEPSVTTNIFVKALRDALPSSKAGHVMGLRDA
ncbi:hypothetical protein B0H19DRAFT_1073754 [Mycena capillaripes]|nr:hypothetical protein B0H19DRAFT_1073754 [Mycena capillaripes]